MIYVWDTCICSKLYTCKKYPSVKIRNDEMKTSVNVETYVFSLQAIRRGVQGILIVNIDILRCLKSVKKGRVQNNFYVNHSKLSKRNKPCRLRERRTKYTLLWILIFVLLYNVHSCMLISRIFYYFLWCTNYCAKSLVDEMRLLLSTFKNFLKSNNFVVDQLLFTLSYI